MSTDTPDRGGAPRPQGITGTTSRTDRDSTVAMPPADTRLLVAAGVCLLIPVVALMWVSSYARETPRLGGVPFFFWYQFAWVFLTSALTWTAHRLVIAARRPGDQARERFRDEHFRDADLGPEGDRR